MVNTFNSVYSSGFRSSFLGICEPIGMKKLLFLGICVWCSSTALGQYSLSDTVKVMEVEVTASRNRFFQDDFKTFTTDTLLNELFKNDNLQGVLQSIAPVQVMNYGSAGSLSSIRLRGGNGNHTQVNWNGFPINSLTTGSADVSLLSMGLGDQVSITYGGSGAIYGSGAIGGVVDIEHDPQFSKGVEVIGNYEYGSFDHHQQVTSVEIGGEKLVVSLKSLVLNAQNDFPFEDTRETDRINDHNAVRSFAIVPYLDINGGKMGRFGVGAWYQQKEKKIPVTMNSIPSAESSQHQTDSLFRVFGKWNYVGDGYSLEYKTGFFKEQLLYTDKNEPGDEYYKLYSNIRSKRIYNDANIRLFLSNHLSLDLGAQFSFFEAKVTAYGNDPIREEDGAFIAAAKYRQSDFVINLSSRLAYNSVYGTIPLFAMGGKYQLVDDLVGIRFSAATRYRQPTFNDRYWQPYGNPDLKPEKGYNLETGVEGKWKVGAHQLSYDLASYYSQVKDWIEWAPVDDEDKQGMEPLNNKKVKTWGIELGFRDQLIWSNGFLRMEGNYAFNHTTINDEASVNYGNFMAYTPVHKGTVSIIGGYRKWLLAGYGNFSGKRYSSEDNGPYDDLPAYFVGNIQLKYKKQFNKFQLNAFVKVNNVFNTSYQEIKFYQMPGRAYYLGIELSYKYKK